MRWMSAVTSCSQMRSALSICRPCKLQLHGSRVAQRGYLRLLEVRVVLANESLLGTRHTNPSIAIR